jgi:hypothetical protein
MIMKTILNVLVLATLLVMIPEASSTAHAASVPDTLPLEKAGKLPAAGSADTLESLRERLKKEVGGQWRPETWRAGITEDPAIWATFPT